MADKWGMMGADFSIEICIQIKFEAKTDDYIKSFFFNKAYINI